jgi:hypothetical protein
MAPIFHFFSDSLIRGLVRVGMFVSMIVAFTTSASNDFVAIDDDASWQWACDGSVCDSQGGSVKPNGCCATNCCYGSNKRCNVNGECEMCGYTATVAIGSSSIGAILFCIFCMSSIGGGVTCCWWQRRRLRLLREQQVYAGVVEYRPSGAVQLQMFENRPSAYYGHGSIPGMLPVQYGPPPGQYGGLTPQYSGMPSQYGQYSGMPSQYGISSQTAQYATAAVIAVPPLAEVVLEDY